MAAVYGVPEIEIMALIGSAQKKIKDARERREAQD
jgi:hypothetical protein